MLSICGIDDFGPGVDLRVPFVIIQQFLSARDFQLCTSTCSCLYLDRTFLSLSATALRLGIYGRWEDYEVPTPPLAVSPWAD